MATATQPRTLIPRSALSCSPLSIDPTAPTNGLMGAYFAGSADGPRLFTRVDGPLVFDWTSGSPGTGVPGDRFLVSWTGHLVPRVTGPHVITAIADDGIRLRLAGALVLDQWAYQHLRPTSGTVTLQAGVPVPIEVLYREDAGRAALSLAWSAPGLPAEPIPRDAFTPGDLIPAPPQNLTWTYNGQLADLQGVDRLRLAWAPPADASAHGYRVDRRLGEGAWESVVSLLGVPFVEDDVPAAAGTVTYRITSLSAAGTASVPFEQTLLLPPPPANGEGLVVEYFTDLVLTKPLRQDVVPTLDLDWLTSQRPLGPFSARWTGEVVLREAGTWTFLMATDEAVRLWIDDQLVIDRWTNRLSRTYAGTVTGQRNQRLRLRVDYADRTAGARCTLRWQGPQSQEGVIPTSQLLPTDILAPAPVTNLLARIEAERTVLTWTAAYDNRPPVRYEIRRQDSPIALITATTCADDTPPLGETRYEVTAIDGAGHRSQPVAVTVDRPAPGLLGTGTGLRVTYFRTADLQTPVRVALDPILDHDWGGRPPVPELTSGNSWSARWEGTLEPTVTGRGTLSLRCDDGVRLWLGGVLVLDSWRYTGLNPRSVAVDWVAGRRLPLRLEFYQATGPSRLLVQWRVGSALDEIVPTTALYPAPLGDPPRILAVTPPAPELRGVTMTLQATAWSALGGTDLQPTWTILAGPAPGVLTTLPSTVVDGTMTTSVTFRPAAPGLYRHGLTVRDGAQRTVSDEVPVTVVPTLSSLAVVPQQVTP